MNPLCSMKLKLTFRSKLQVPIYGAKFILKGIPEGMLFLPEIDGNEPVEGQIEILVSIRVMVHSNPYNPVPLFYSTMPQYVSFCFRKRMMMESGSGICGCWARTKIVLGTKSSGEL